MVSYILTATEMFEQSMESYFQNILATNQEELVQSYFF